MTAGADSMTDKPGIVVTGASGRMGRMLVQTITDTIAYSTVFETSRTRVIT